MNSRERFYKICSHQEADRVPLDLGGWLSGIKPAVYARLREALKLKGEPLAWYKDFDSRVLERFQIDFRRVTPGSKKPAKPRAPLSDGTSFDNWGVGSKFSGEDQQNVFFPLKDATREDLDKYQWPDFHAMGVRDEIVEQAKRLHNDTPFVVVGQAASAGVFERACWLCGFERILMGMAIEPEFTVKLFGIIHKLQKDSSEVFYGAVGKYLDMVQLGDDYGTQNGTFFSLDFYKEFIKPVNKSYIADIRQYTKAKIFLHSCGSIHSFLGDLIEDGVDIINPVQTRALNMEPERLKQDFGDKVVFHGAIDEQEILPFGSVSDVKKEVKHKIETLGKDGGYILAACHEIQNDTPVENIIAMYESALEYGRY